MGLYAYAMSENYQNSVFGARKEMKVDPETNKSKHRQSEMHMFAQESKVPMLSDNLTTSSGVKVSETLSKL